MFTFIYIIVMTTFLTFNRENPIHRIKSYLGSGSVSESGSGSIITDADPRIRIHIKMIRIRNTACLYLKRVSALCLCEEFYFRFTTVPSNPLSVQKRASHCFYSVTNRFQQICTLSVQLYSHVTSVNPVFAFDKIINNIDNFRIKSLFYSKISAILCVIYFLFLNFFI